MSSPPTKESTAATSTTGSEKENPEQGTDPTSGSAKRKADQISGNEVADGDQPPALWDLFLQLYEFLGINDKTKLLFVCRDLNKAVKSARSLQLPCLVWEKRVSLGFRPISSRIDLHQNFAFDIVGCQGDDPHLHVQMAIVDTAWEYLQEKYQLREALVNPTQLQDIRIRRGGPQGKVLFRFGENKIGRYIVLGDDFFYEEMFDGVTEDQKNQLRRENRLWDAITEHHKNQLRRYMQHFYDCVKYFVQSRDSSISYPSAERLMHMWRKKLHSYFPHDFDWEAAKGGITRTVGLGNSLYREQLAPNLKGSAQYFENWERVLDGNAPLIEWNRWEMVESGTGL